MKKCLILILTIISILGCKQEINTKPLPRNPIEMETFENGLKYIHIKSNAPNIYLNLTVNAGSINAIDIKISADRASSVRSPPTLSLPSA